jgi:hypothetical protein
MLNSNFEFLSGNWNELYDVAKLAESKVLIDPNSTLIKLRLFSELFTKYVFTYERFKEPLRMTQKERMDYLLKEGAITTEIYDMLDTFRLKGNKAVHEANYGSINESKKMLRLAFYLGGWLKQLYNQWDFELPEYRDLDPDEVFSSTIEPGGIEKIIESSTYKKIEGLTNMESIIETFSNNDHDYENWLKGNKSGYVFNHYGGNDASKDMNKVHHASCRFLHRKADEGKRTTAYPKICSNSLDDLQVHIVQLRGESWVFCKSCNLY